MIKTYKTEQEIINLIHSNTIATTTSPERIIFKDWLSIRYNIYNFSKNGALYLFSSSRRKGIVNPIFRIIIKNNNDHRLVIFKPKPTKLTWFFGFLAYLCFIFPVFLSLNSKMNLFTYFKIASIFLAVFGLILTGLYWVIKTGERQSLEKEIDTFIG